ncbi:MAG: diadenylate cyclase CdaA [Candidatus Omnitrophota bacterium]
MPSDIQFTNIIQLLNISKPLFEIIILWFVLYQIMLFFEGTRAFQVLRGIIVLILAFIIVQSLKFYTLEWLLTRIFAISIIAFLIIFQPEIRQGLARIGRKHLFHTSLGEEELEEMLSEIINSSIKMAHRKNGALIVIEKEDTLKQFIETGIVIDGKISEEIMQSIFNPLSVLHDGAIIIQAGRIIAAGCVLPLSEIPKLERHLGTRHRAAIGLTEQTDAIVIVVSEENGTISLAEEGRLMQNLDKEELFKKLKNSLRSNDGKNKK